ncbi:protein of unknown function [Tenacibaculum sp. 190524A02b]|uniref:hypothetical protein n=1 Tax=Tenacibaculum vairaonense TaxID=3137860 RepID=UPI0032B0F766
MRVLLFTILLIILTSCTTKSFEDLEKLAWSNLYELKIEKAHSLFVELNGIKKTEKNILGLAYTQAILGKENYVRTLSENINDSDLTYNYGFMVAGFKTYYEGNQENNPEFSMEEFKAFHNGGKFEAKKGFNIVIGEYENLKPKGIWEYYTLDKKLLRKVDSEKMWKNN